MFKKIIAHRLFYPAVLSFFIIILYYKFFLMGAIPFPGDLLVTSYSPWFDYYKFPVQNPLISDIFSQFYLWKYLAIDSFNNLQWPLWNPYSFTGTPLLATYHSAVLYPLNIILFLPQKIGWGLFIFTQTLIASLTMYLLLSFWVKSNIARILGALIYSLGGLMTTWLEFGTAVHGMAWLPLSLYLLLKFASTKKLKYVTFMVIPLILTTLAGNVQVTTYAYVIVLLFASIIFLGNRIQNSPSYFVPIIIACALAILISAAQLIPSFDLLQKSIRSEDSYIKQNNYGLLPPGDLIKFFIPDYFGNPVTRNYWGFLNYSETSSFVGSLTLPLLLFALFSLKKNRTVNFFIFLLIASLILSFDNPLSKYIYSHNIPLLTMSYASRMLLVANLSISILVALALNQIVAMRQETKLIIPLVLSTVITLGILLITLFIFKRVPLITNSPLLKSLFALSLSDPDYLSNIMVSVRNTILPAVICLGALLTILIFTKTKTLAKLSLNSVTIIPVLLTAVIGIDLGRYFLKYNPFVDYSLVYPVTPALEFLKNQPGYFRVGREHAEIFPPNTWTAYNLQSIEGYDPVYLKKYSQYMNFLNGGDIRKNGAGRYAELSSGYNSPYIDSSNIKYFLGILRDKNGYIPGDQINYLFNKADYKPVFKDKSAVVLENPKALDRAYLAKSIVIAPEEKIEDIMMEDKSFNPTQTTAISTDLGVKQVSGKGWVTIKEYSSNKVSIQTNTLSDEILVLADQFEEGWKAQVDNQKTNISRANVIFRAVKVPVGNHLITFYYWPDSFQTGLIISAVTLTIFLTSILLIKIRIIKI